MPPSEGPLPGDDDGPARSPPGDDDGPAREGASDRHTRSDGSDPEDETVPDDLREALADVVDARERVIAAVVRFAGLLRDEGVDVSTDDVVTATAALAEPVIGDRATVRAATRAALVSRKRDRSVFDRLFDGFWRDLRAIGGQRPVSGPETSSDDGASEKRHGVPIAGESPTTSERQANHTPDNSTWSETGSPSDGRLATPGEQTDETPLELSRYSQAGRSSAVERTTGRPDDRLATAVEGLTRALESAPGRRSRPATDGRFVDARRALRASLETGGLVADLPESERPDSVVRGTVLVDVSQSVLDSVDRGFLLEWLRLLAANWRSLRVFFFDTDVREVTAAFDEGSVRDVSLALARAEAAWGGGTRIGDAFETVRRSYPGAVDGRTVVVVVSDGLERGETDAVERGVAWLSRRARLLLWLNPLASSPVYQPTARGMAAALPAVDGLFAFAEPADVAELARQLERHDRTHLGYEYDHRRADPGRTDPAGTGSG